MKIYVPVFFDIKMNHFITDRAMRMFKSVPILHYLPKNKFQEVIGSVTKLNAFFSHTEHLLLYYLLQMKESKQITRYDIKWNK